VLVGVFVGVRVGVGVGVGGGHDLIAPSYIHCPYSYVTEILLPLTVLYIAQTLYSSFADNVPTIYGSSQSGYLHRVNEKFISKLFKFLIVVHIHSPVTPTVGVGVTVGEIDGVCVGVVV
jgi:hypothetical protein